MCGLLQVTVTDWKTNINKHCQHAWIKVFSDNEMSFALFSNGISVRDLLQLRGKEKGFKCLSNSIKLEQVQSGSILVLSKTLRASSVTTIRWHGQGRGDTGTKKTNKNKPKQKNKPGSQHEDSAVTPSEYFP